jgi:crotonobetaine/carnitine-CoA ligase
VAVDKSEWVVGKVLADQARTRGDAPFVQFEDGPPHSYAKAHELCNRVGNAFSGIGVGFGDNVAVMLNNRLEYLWIWIGLGRTGGVPVAINTALKGSFLTHVLTNTKARTGVVEPEFLPWLADIEETIPDLETVYVPADVYDPKDVPAFKRIEVKSFDELMSGPADEIDVEVTYRDIGMIMFTSGTTGPSKGVLMPHGHLYLFGLSMQLHMEMTPDDRYYVSMPLFHAQGILMQTYATMITGGSMVLVKLFRASTWIDDVRKYEATLTNLLGVMNDFVLAQPAKPTDTDNKLRLVSAVPVTRRTRPAVPARSGTNISRSSSPIPKPTRNFPSARSAKSWSGRRNPIASCRVITGWRNARSIRGGTSGFTPAMPAISMSAAMFGTSTVSRTPSAGAARTSPPTRSKPSCWSTRRSRKPPPSP